MEAYHGPAFSGPIFPQGSHDTGCKEPQRLHGTIVSVQPGRRGNEKTRILTITIDGLVPEPQDLLYTSVELFVQRPVELRTKR